jgi:serine protease
MMFSSRVRRSARRVITLAAIAAAVMSSSPIGARRQGDPTPLPFRLSAIEVAARVDAVRQHLRYVPNQVVVKFKPGVARAGQQRALMALRSRPSVDTLRWAGPVAVLTDVSQSNPLILAQQLREQPEVQFAGPNYLRHTTARPNDPGYSSRQWNFDAIDLPRAWDINAGASSGVTMAIVDTGVTTINSSLVFRTWNGSGFVNANVPFAINPDLTPSRIVAPFDFAFLNSSLVLDMNGHGTHVSSTAGEDTNNDLLEAGIAYNAKIMPVKVCLSYWELQFLMSARGIPGFTPPSEEGSCADADTAAGIRYAADMGAKVINLSLGGPGEVPILRDALTYAVSKGAFVAISAGNSFDQGNEGDFPAAYAAEINGVMAVGAVGRTLRHSYFSTTASYVEITAPGGDVQAGGAAGAIWQSTIRGSDSDPETIVFPRFDRYEESGYQGTSMASPHVAGVAALLYSQLGSAATPALVEQILKKTARVCDDDSCDSGAARVGTLGRNDMFGAGLLQARAARFGFGLRK